MRYKELDFSELEELSAVGGMDGRGAEVNSPITVSWVKNMSSYESFDELYYSKSRLLKEQDV